MSPHHRMFPCGNALAALPADRQRSCGSVWGGRRSLFTPISKKGASGSSRGCEMCDASRETALPRDHQRAHRPLGSRRLHG